MFNFFNSPYSNGNRTTNSAVESVSAESFDTLQKAREDLIGEIQAIIQYDAHLHSTTDRLAKETWENIKNEELVHVGELLALINHLDPSQQKFVKEGISEFMERMGNKNNL